MLNPAGHRILGVAPRPMPARHRRAAAGRAGAGRAGPRRRQRRPRPPCRAAMWRRGLVGGPSHLGVTLSPLGRRPAGEAGVICLFTDLSRVVALEEQLRLKDALARLGELTAGLAHEFRNGLATIHGYARLLDPGTLPAPQSTYAAGLRAETHALGELVTHFLDFARPERMSLQPLDLELGRDARRRRRRSRRPGGPGLGAVRRGRGRRRAAAAGLREPDAQRPRGVPRRRHRARGRRARRGHRRRRDGDGDGHRQRSRPARRRTATGCSSPSSRRAPTAPASAWRWCRSSSSRTTGACAPGTPPRAARCSRSTCRCERLGRRHASGQLLRRPRASLRGGSSHVSGAARRHAAREFTPRSSRRVTARYAADRGVALLAASMPRAAEEAGWDAMRSGRTAGSR